MASDLTTSNDDDLVDDKTEQYLRAARVVNAITPRGKNKFFEMAERALGRRLDGKPVDARSSPWFYMSLRASESGILPDRELRAILDG